MRIKSLGLAVTLLACGIAYASAATPGGRLTRESLLTSKTLSRFSVGADVSFMERGFDLAGRPGGTNAQARTTGAYVGYDILPWLTVFGTLGASQAKGGEDGGGYWSSDLKYSLGVAPNIWEAELRRPTFLTGKVSIDAAAEVGMFKSSSDNASAEWTDLSAAVLLRYEVPEDAPWSAESATSLRLSAGPLFSLLDGRWRDSVARSSISARNLVGWTAGAEWFIAPTFSVGANVEVFDTTSVSAAVRLHF